MTAELLYFKVLEKWDRELTLQERTLDYFERLDKDQKRNATGKSDEPGSIERNNHEITQRIKHCSDS